MWTLTKDECKSWCIGRGFKLGPDELPLHNAKENSSSSVPLASVAISRLSWLSKALAKYLITYDDYDDCLVWVTSWGIWPSSENFHLFYRFRESYGERRPLHQAPGHLFSQYEEADLASLIELAILFGWDFHILPSTSGPTAFITHDEFIDIYAPDRESHESFKALLGNIPLS